MCGRFLLFTCEEYEEILSIIRDVEISNSTPQINMYQKLDIYPGDRVPIIIPSSHNEKSVLFSKWGFPDFRNTSRLLINARSETLEEKPTFNKLINSKRCLIPALGFYEWKSNGKAKDKYFIRPRESQFFYMAGLYNNFNDKAGSEYTSFVVITTTANNEMKTIHDRMPVLICSKSSANKWLDSESPWASIQKPMLIPYQKELYMENQNPQLQFPI